MFCGRRHKCACGRNEVELSYESDLGVHGMATLVIPKNEMSAILVVILVGNPESQNQVQRLENSCFSRKFLGKI